MTWSAPIDRTRSTFLPLQTPVYPEELERWIELKDKSKAFLRPLKLTDESLLREMFYKLSPESVRHRFFSLIKAMPHEKLQQFLRVDYDADMALVVLTNSSENAQIVGIAHYTRDARTNFADAAFLVDEVMPTSPAFSWTLNHTVEVDDPMELFSLTEIEVS